MEAIVRQRLIRMTADFYSFHASAFDASRRQGWQSWNRILEEGSPSPRSVLDLGCGNGRFAGFLAQNGVTDCSYVGVDTDRRLLEMARERHPQHDFRELDVESALSSVGQFDLVVCFGVFHHLPDAEYRSGILNSVCGAIGEIGSAVVSLWQPQLLDNFSSKVMPRTEDDGLDGSDFLMGWNGDFSHLRYCHAFTDVEIEDLVASSPMTLTSQFQGSGNDASNRYLIFKR